MPRVLSIGNHRRSRRPSGGPWVASCANAVLPCEPQGRGEPCAGLFRPLRMAPRERDQTSSISRVPSPAPGKDRPPRCSLLKRHVPRPIYHPVPRLGQVLGRLASASIASSLQRLVFAQPAFAQNASAPYTFERGFQTAETTQRARAGDHLRRAVTAYHFWCSTVSYGRHLQRQPRIRRPGRSNRLASVSRTAPNSLHRYTEMLTQKCASARRDD